MGAARYAIYAAPLPDDPLWAFGCGVIGYDAATGATVDKGTFAGFEPDVWASLTAEPRRYGFHGTLKAPFELADGVGEHDLARALDAFGAARQVALGGRLAVTRLGRFVALCPEGRPPALHALADDVVASFDRFRAPLSPADRARRKPEALSERQRGYLDRFGYPYVLEDFRYHMTLTGPLSPEHAPEVAAALTAAFMPLEVQPFSVDALVLFKQPSRDARFHILSRHPLTA